MSHSTDKAQKEGEKKMKWLGYLVAVLVLLCSSASAQDNETILYAPDSDDEIATEIGLEMNDIADPLEPWNRMMFSFNDMFYSWAFRPFVKAYTRVVPKPFRVAGRNFFRNLGMPVTLVNTLLQGKIKAAGIVTARFCMNTTAGVLGFVDVAQRRGLRRRSEDLGQTLGVYGLGDGFYIVWPFMGPSSLRDTVGSVGDGFLDPLYYIHASELKFAVSSYKYMNDNSFDVERYEAFKQESVDAYSAIKSAYYQHRNEKIQQ